MLALGIDIGSVSSKVAAINQDKKVVASVYLETEGTPISAIQELIKRLKGQLPEDAICGIGITGSGRHIAAYLLGADLVKNEVTAQTIAALHYNPNVRSIIEIGGQDSKVILLKDGIPVWHNLNSICVTEDTEITTGEYISKKIKDIQTGDKVMTHKGRFKRVKNKFIRNYEGRILKIRVGMEELKITPEHPILALKREVIKYYRKKSRGNKIAIYKPFQKKNLNYNPRFIPARELKEGDFIVTPLPSETQCYPSIEYDKVKDTGSFKYDRPLRKKIDNFSFNKETLHLLGYYLAEGSIQYNYVKHRNTKSPSGLDFVFNINEKNYIKRIFKIMSLNFPGVTIKLVKKPENHSAIIEMHSKALAQFIIYLCGTGADKKRLHHKLLNLPPVLQKEILKGFFEGDGYLGKRENKKFFKSANKYIATTVSKNLAQQLYWLLLRNKIQCKIYKAKHKTKGKKIRYNIAVYGTEIDKLMDKKLAILAHKSAFKSFIYSDWLYEPIVDIKQEAYKGKVYNLEVKRDNSYIANLLAVHNCAAGTGSFLSAQAYRLKIPIERFGELALHSRVKVSISAKCTVFCESDCIHKQAFGYKKEDIINGLCEGLARNFINNVARNKDIEATTLFSGGVAANIGVVRAFERELNHPVIVPKHHKIMGCIGVALLVLRQYKEERKLTKFKGFEILNRGFKTEPFACKGCANNCEVVRILENDKAIGYMNSRCGRYQ